MPCQHCWVKPSHLCSAVCSTWWDNIHATLCYASTVGGETLPLRSAVYGGILFTLHYAMPAPTGHYAQQYEPYNGILFTNLYRSISTSNLDIAVRISQPYYRISGNFRVVKFSCFKFSCHNIFVDQVTHEKIFTATSLTRRRKVVRRACCEATAFIRNLGKQLLAKNS